MPALKPVQGVIKFRFRHTIGSDLDTGFHIYVFYGPTPPTPAQASSAASAASVAWNNSIGPLAHPDTHLTEVTATDLSDPAGAFGADASVQVGTRAGGQLPASTAFLINFLVNRRYRGGKPRVYLIAGTDTDLATPQTWTPAFVTAANSGFQNMLNAMLTNMASWAAGAYQCNVSYYAGHEWKPDGSDGYIKKPIPRPIPLVDPIIGHTGSALLGSQRRRVRP